MAIKDYIELMIPYHFPISLSGFLAGYFILSANASPANLIISAFVVSVLLVGAFNSFNGVFDKDIDMINKSYRPIPSGKISQESALYFSLFLYLLAVLSSLLINTDFLLLVLLNLLLITLYSIPKIRLKDRFLLSNLTVSTQYGIFPILFSYTLSPAKILPLELLAFTFMLAFSTSATKDFQDYIGDRAFNVNTLPVVLGPIRFSNIVSVFLLIPYMYILLMSFFGVFKLAAILSCSLLIFAIKIGNDLRENPNDRYGLVIKKSVLLYISTLLIITILFSV